ncbi:MAG: hypothetical protein K1X75_01350 [Leptospirales bacterium]|nr:hypothetical protein [Leptospirales bacterium]
MKRKIQIAGAMALILNMSYCPLGAGSEDDSDEQGQNAALLLAGLILTTPEIAGRWHDNGFNTDLTVSPVNSIWTAAGTGTGYSFTYALREFDNSLNRFYYECTAQTGGGCTVGQFGAVAWTQPDGSSFYWCEYSFSQSSLAAAKAASASSANASNLSSGCAGFSWTRYDRR